MLIYFVLLAIVAILAKGYDRSKSGIYLIFIFIFMTLLAGLRDVNGRIPGVTISNLMIDHYGQILIFLKI